MKLSELNPKFVDECWIVIDIKDAPRLANAIGSRIYRRWIDAIAHAEKTRRFVDVEHRRYIQVVPVEGRSEHYAVDHMDASGVTVRDDGQIKIAR